MDPKLEHIESQVGSKRNFDSPPLHLWQPPLSGDIAIHIDAEGRWFHEGDAIKRQAIVNLFSRILRREEDGEYYLVTPAEKWRIDVALHPLVVVDVDSAGESEGEVITLTLNNGAQLEVGPDHPLHPESRREGVAVVSLAHGLTAILSRPCWYRLVELAGDAMQIRSNGYEYKLAQV